MATDLTTSQAVSVALAAEGRDQANVLLHTLMNDRRLVEERCAANGRNDPLKALTGRSSMDQAIVSTREIITRMDDLLAELRATLPPANPNANGSTNGNGHSNGNGVAKTPAQVGTGS